jgi:hypothetical protein
MVRSEKIANDDLSKSAGKDIQQNDYIINLILKGSELSSAELEGEVVKFKQNKIDRFQVFKSSYLNMVKRYNDCKDKPLGESESHKRYFGIGKTVTIFKKNSDFDVFLTALKTLFNSIQALDSYFKEKKIPQNSEQRKICVTLMQELYSLIEILDNVEKGSVEYEKAKKDLTSVKTSLLLLLKRMKSNKILGPILA